MRKTDLLLQDIPTSIGPWLWYIPSGERRFVLSAHVLQQDEKGERMKKKNNKNHQPDMLEEYDFSSGVQGKYAKRYREGTNVIVLDSDVAKVFHDQESVNHALRALAEVIHHQEQNT
jgi:hypothetical protein